VDASTSKKSSLDNSRVFSTGYPPRYSSNPGEERKNVEANRGRTGEDKLSALKSYRKAKGLCFKCGEKWHPGHKCQNVSLHALEELWEFLSDDPVEKQGPVQAEEEEEDSGEDLMAISVQAVRGTDSETTIRLRGFISGQEAYMLVDSGSTHCFISEAAAAKIQGKRALSVPVQVRVANGNIIQCTHELPDQVWLLQGKSFRSTFKILPIDSYDAILGMDWLGKHSPMQIHWTEKWLEFQHKGKLVKVQGIPPQAQVGSPISQNQLEAMEKQGSVLCCVQLNSVSGEQTPETSIPAEIHELIYQYSDIFQPIPGLPPKREGDHTIPLLPGATPFRLRPYRYNPFQKDEIERQVKELLEKGLIRHSSSPYSSPMLLVKKKTGDWRLCVDYRRLNALTVKNKYPLPVIDELLDELGGSSWFSSLDLCSGFHQIRMAEGHEYKTAFQTHNGHYEYQVMPYGVTGGPATFQEIMNIVLDPGLRKFVVVFIDDVLIYSATW